MSDAANRPHDVEPWVAVQKKTFTKWTNMHLRRRGYPFLEDLQNEFKNGINLMNLINCLYQLPLPKYNKNPKMRPHLLDNVSLALNMVDEAKIKTNFLKPVHLVDCDLKMILGMIWSIILDFQIKGISVEEMTAKDGLLLWCRKKTQGYKDVNVENFTSSWTNGLAFCALIHRHRPDLLDFDPLDKANARQNLELAFEIADKHLGIPRLLDVEDLLDVKPDEKSIMTYVSEYFHAFASQDLKEIAARRIQKFVQFSRQIQQMENDYEKGARELLDWINNAISIMENRNFGDSYDKAQAAFDAHKAFLVHEKSQRAGQKVDLEGQFAQIQTKLRINGRSRYQTPDELSPDALEAAWERLANAEKEKGKAVRENMFRFITTAKTTVSDDQLREFEAAFEHFDTDKDGYLTKAEFKACLSSLSVPFKDEEAFNRCFTQVAEGSDKLSKPQFINYMINLVEDKDDPQQLKDSFRILASGQDTVSADNLKVRPLKDEEVNFLTTNMPPSGTCYNYSQYVDTVFKA